MPSQFITNIHPKTTATTLLLIPIFVYKRSVSLSLARLPELPQVRLVQVRSVRRSKLLGIIVAELCRPNALPVPNQTASNTDGRQCS